VIGNRSVPLEGVLPHLCYRDADAALEWLHRVFGFAECYRAREDDGRVHIAQMRLGPAYIMIRRARADRGEVSPADAGGATQSLMVIVPDVDDHHARAVAAGAHVTTAPVDHMYGEREYTAVDLDGHPWTFTQHVADVDPASFADVALPGTDS
jgi:uncharacterized glyoxalase superfamily protein PhnB